MPVPRKQSINLDLGRGSIVMAWDSEVLVLIAQSSVAFIRKRSAQRLDLPAMGVVREHSSRWLWCDRSWLSLDWSYEKDVVPDNEIIVFAAKSRQADIKGQVLRKYRYPARTWLVYCICIGLVPWKIVVYCTNASYLSVPSPGTAVSSQVSHGLEGCS